MTFFESFLSKIGSRQEPFVEFATNPGLILGNENPALRELADYHDLLSSLSDQDLHLRLDGTLARGLAYYTGIIFEVTTPEVNIGSLCGGGRYDDLTSLFQKEKVSGVGISFGLDRIYEILASAGKLDDIECPAARVLLTHLDRVSYLEAFKHLHEYRKSGIPSLLYPEIAKIRKQLHLADKMGIPYVVTIGENEIKEERYSLKTMRTGEVRMMGKEEIINFLLD